MISRFFITDDKRWLKYGDLLENAETVEQLNEYLSLELEPNYDLRTAINAELAHRYKYRYLFCNDYPAWLSTFHNVLLSIRLQYNLHKTAWMKLNADWIDTDFLRNIQHNTTIGSNTTTNVTAGNTATTTNTSITQSTTTPNTQSTSNTTVKDTSIYTDETAHTGTDTTQNTGTNTVTPNLTISDSGTNSNTTTFKDDTVTSNTTATENGQIGVKTTASTPAADTVTKTIQTAVNPPMNATDGIAGQTSGAETIHSDNINTATPFEIGANGYISGGQETIVYNNLQREQNGNYKQNITTETYGQYNSTTELYEPLKQTTQSHTTTTVSRADGATVNTTTTSNGTTGNTQTQTGNTQTTGNSTNTTQYNDKNTLTHTGLDDNAHNVKTEQTVHNTGTETTKIEGLDDATHNLKTVNSGTTATTQTGTGTNALTGTDTGYNNNKSDNYLKFLTAISTAPFIDWVAKQFEQLFSEYYSCDDRDYLDISDFSEWEG